MLIEPQLLGPVTRIVTFGLAGIVLALAALSAPWRVWLDDRERQWVWLASLGLLVGVWSMKAGITPGLSLRFLMMTALTLMHGWQLAVIGGALVLAVLAVVGQAVERAHTSDDAVPHHRLGLVGERFEEGEVGGRVQLAPDDLGPGVVEEREALRGGSGGQGGHRRTASLLGIESDPIEAGRCLVDHERVRLNGGVERDLGGVVTAVWIGAIVAVLGALFALWPDRRRRRES